MKIKKKKTGLIILASELHQRHLLCSQFRVQSRAQIRLYYSEPLNQELSTDYRVLISS